ncbi:MAG: hypothetical protein EBR82_10120 [Caulobacteraceae bacterium]|nr:hypothetical protein [Caulobacteraceae bacterium]
MAKTHDGLYKASSQSWETHPDIIKAVLLALDRNIFSIDVCCSRENIPAWTHFKNHLGDSNPFLTGEKLPNICYFGDKVAWCNPPFDKAALWLHAANLQQSKNNLSTVALVPVRTETKYWHDVVMADNTLVLFLQGKWAFYMDGEPALMKGGKEGKAPCALALVVFGNIFERQNFFRRWQQQDIVKATAMWRFPNG